MGSITYHDPYHVQNQTLHFIIYATFMRETLSRIFYMKYWRFFGSLFSRRKISVFLCQRFLVKPDTPILISKDVLYRLYCWFCIHLK